jgi:2-isopropylmalate synthase
MERIRIFDTTLRDGEQSPGYGMAASQELVLARQLDRLGVDIIEGGFPAASNEDLAGVRDICRELRKRVGGVTISTSVKPPQVDVSHNAPRIVPAEAGGE